MANWIRKTVEKVGCQRKGRKKNRVPKEWREQDVKKKRNRGW